MHGEASLEDEDSMELEGVDSSIEGDGEGVPPGAAAASGADENGDDNDGGGGGGDDKSDVSSDKSEVEKTPEAPTGPSPLLLRLMPDPITVKERSLFLHLCAAEKVRGKIISSQTATPGPFSVV